MAPQVERRTISLPANLPLPALFPSQPGNQHLPLQWLMAPGCFRYPQQKEPATTEWAWENRHSNLPQHLRSGHQPSTTALPRTMLSVLLFRRLCLLPMKLRANNRFMPAPKQCCSGRLPPAPLQCLSGRAAAHVQILRVCLFDIWAQNLVLTQWERGWCCPAGQALLRLSSRGLHCTDRRCGGACHKYSRPFPPAHQVLMDDGSAQSRLS